MFRPPLFYLFFISCCLFGSLAQAQEDYFQQEVHYKIVCELDDEQHLLHSHLELRYINHSPDTLRELYMHLWPNAYRNRSTAFAQQKLESGSLRFHQASEEERGGLDSLHFKINQDSVVWSYVAPHIDIARLELPQGLAPGDSMVLTTPFRLDIPSSFSRLGHVKQSYQMTQWYPKPAVYDTEGWHHMPYLDQGEFYSEFGSFDVKITLPANYIVGATGFLRTESEQQFLEKKATQDALLDFKQLSEETDTFPTSSSEIKTLHYQAENVHDFAWFADKRFHVLKSEVELASGKKVDTWAMFTNKEADLWDSATLYLNRSVRFYSDVVGEYPYPHATAVQSALSAGAGMEYPMITVIGLSGSAYSLDQVITHEVGHNWFYGILGSNERDFPWMDEGLNSYVEERYMKTYRGNSSMQLGPVNLDGDPGYIAYLFQARRGKDQAINTRAAANTSINYFICAYSKPTLVFSYLEAYLGTEKIDSLLHRYYEKWKFKHPYPSDLQASFEQNSEEDLDWFFDNVIETDNKIDYAIKGGRCCRKDEQTELYIDNRGNIRSPFSISSVDADNKIQETLWYKGIAPGTDTTILLPKAQRYTIDGETVIPEINRRNNSIRRTGLLKTVEPLQLKLIPSIEDPKKTTLLVAPAMGWNANNGFMLGGLVHNYELLEKPLEFAFAPMYAFGSQSFSGLGQISYQWYNSDAWWRHIRIGIGGRSFSQAYSSTYDEHNFYHKLRPFAELTFRKPSPRSSVEHRLTVESHLIWINRVVGEDIITLEFNRELQQYNIQQLRYHYKNNQTLQQQSGMALFEQAQGFGKLSAEFQQRWNYSVPGGQTKKQWFQLRGFAGAFLWESATPGVFRNFVTSARPRTDYLFEEHIIDRSTSTSANPIQSIWSQQIFMRDGQMRSLTNQGSSSTALFALNADWKLPSVRGPLRVLSRIVRPYADLSIVNQATNTEQWQMYFTAGLTVPVLNDAFEIYLPLYSNPVIQNGATYMLRDRWYQRIAFRFDLNQFNLFERKDALLDEMF